MLGGSKSAYAAAGRRAALCLSASMLALAVPALAQAPAAATAPTPPPPPPAGSNAALSDPGTPTASADVGLEEIIVSATKRDESLQTVPISITAFTTKTLEQLNVTDFASYAQFLPSVSFQYGGPGSSRVYFRGIVSGNDGNHSASLPSVGTYLDEQPVTTITGALDIHVYDIARVEALAGPQGTLYGASSQAGTIRIITNKPDPGGFSASYNVGFNTTAHGTPGYVGEGYANVPLSDKAAIRLVGWYEHDGGYIDNLPATRTYPTSGITINNDLYAKNNFNWVDTYGGRLALKVDLNDNWTILPQIMGQVTNSPGVFFYQPNVGYLDVERFAPDTFNDSWGQAALTVNGDLGNFTLTYAGAYLKRQINGQSDYSDYSFFYDELFGYGVYITDDNGNLINPSQRIVSYDAFTKQSHELRIASDTASRFRYVAGAFFQVQKHNIEQNYIIDGLGTYLEVTGHPDTYWLTKQLRTDKDYALFGEATYDITDALSFTAGGRFYWYDNSLKGFFGFGLAGGGFGSSDGENSCFAAPVVDGGPCTNVDKKTTGNGFLPKFTLTYNFPNGLIYGTYSEGYRPGGINRRGTLPPYQPDYLTNWEFGWKSQMFNNQVRFNGAFFYDTWTDVQLPFLGANGLTEIQNVGNARSVGVEFDITWAPITGLTLTAAGTGLNASLTENYCRISNPQNDCSVPKGNRLLAPDGQELPVVPQFKGNFIARYEWDSGAWQPFVQGSVAYQSSTWSELRTVQRNILGQSSGFALVDISGGFRKNNWRFELYVKNLFDEGGILNRSAACAITTCGGEPYWTVTKPRQIGINIGQSF